jgi:hypothetical protein
MDVLLTLSSRRIPGFKQEGGLRTLPRQLLSVPKKELDARVEQAKRESKRRARS